MKILKEIVNITSYSGANASFANCLRYQEGLDWKKPWKKYIADNATEKVITLNFDSTTYDSFYIAQTNFSAIQIGGESFTLIQDPELGYHKGFFFLSGSGTSVILTIPAQSAPQEIGTFVFGTDID